MEYKDLPQDIKDNLKRKSADNLMKLLKQTDQHIYAKILENKSVKNAMNEKIIDIEFVNEQTLEIHRDLIWNKGFLSYYIKIATQTAVDDTDFKGFEEQVQKSIDKSLQAIKINTNTGVTEIFNNLKNIKHGEKEKILGNIVLKMNAGTITLKSSGWGEPKDILKNCRVAEPVMLFVLKKISEENTGDITVDINEYFDMVGVKRLKKNIDALESGLKFLSSLAIDIKAPVRGKIEPARGNFLSYSIRESSSSKGISRGKIRIMIPWVDILIKGDNQFMFIDANLPKLNRNKYPEALSIGYNLYNRYRNNHRRRKGDWEKLSVNHVLTNIMGITKGQIAKRGYSYHVEKLEKHLIKLEDEGLISWKWEKETKSSKDFLDNNILYIPHNEMVKKINSIDKKKLKNRDYFGVKP